MSRRLVTGATLAAVAVVALVMAVWGVHAATAPFPSSSSDQATCSAAETNVKRVLTRKEVKVSVFNAGARKGQAGRTLTALELRRFQPGDAANAPDGVHVVKAEVWTTEKDDPAAALVAANLGPGTKVVVTSDDLGPGVDVLVGPRFRHLAKRAPTKQALPEPKTSCVKVD